MAVDKAKRIDQLVAKIRSSDSEEGRFNAVISLESLGTEAVEQAFDELIYALHKDESRRVRNHSA